LEQVPQNYLVTLLGVLKLRHLPNDLFVGGVDQMKSFDVNVWIDAMIHESQDSPPFLPAGFEIWADDVLDEANATREDICPSNMCDFYYFLSCQEPPNL
jgi:hypothetical protein